ncbi:hypothetical protein [Legionella sp. 27cVA30]|nr:hypothetical protein [Legionella sp. 27cVA30]
MTILTRQNLNYRGSPGVVTEVVTGEVIEVVTEVVTEFVSDEDSY